MENMRQYRQLVATIVANRAVKYDTSNEQHEILLEKVREDLQIWSLATPRVLKVCRFAISCGTFYDPTSDERADDTVRIGKK